MSEGPTGHREIRKAHGMFNQGDERLKRAYAAAKQTADALVGHPEHKTAVHAVESIEADMMRCMYCHESKRDLERRGEPMEPFNPNG